MGKQYNAVIKRKRRKAYLERKGAAAKVAVKVKGVTSKAKAKKDE